MSLPDSYLSIAQAAEGSYKDKGSKFIGYVFPVKDLEDIKELINSLKELHPKARHICYAYRLGFTPEEARSNDDGEPAGSAGKPILNTILNQSPLHARGRGQVFWRDVARRARFNSGLQRSQFSGIFRC